MTANQIAYQNMLANVAQQQSQAELNRQKTRSEKAQADVDTAESRRTLAYKYSDQKDLQDPEYAKQNGINEWIDWFANEGLEKSKKFWDAMPFRIKI